MQTISLGGESGRGVKNKGHPSGQPLLFSLRLSGGYLSPRRGDQSQSLQDLQPLLLPAAFSVPAEFLLALLLAIIKTLLVRLKLVWAEKGKYIRQARFGCG